MRIQHNIMAMSAYRNYTNNVSAMKKNLEKLSSGYKINRAGDDAAGLAISEKMRAQITGLETAQKNAKDGISLVQTAEGALTEVHDMLNRMVELATQSANGTYEDGTDRTQLQKELNQLRSEINRIADSSNFNGIQLLDGSMSINSTAPIVPSNDPTSAGQASTEYTAANDILGAIADPAGPGATGDTILHADAPDAAIGKFGIALDAMSLGGVAAGATGSVTFTVGTATVTVKGSAGKGMTGKEMATKLATGAGKFFTVGSDGSTAFVSATAAAKGNNKLIYTASDNGDGTVTYTLTGYTNNSGTVTNITNKDDLATLGDTVLTALGRADKLDLSMKISASAGVGTLDDNRQNYGTINVENTQFKGKPTFGNGKSAFSAANIASDATNLRLTIGTGSDAYTINFQLTASGASTDNDADAVVSLVGVDKADYAREIANAFAASAAKNKTGINVGADASGALTLTEITTGTGTSTAPEAIQKAMETVDGFNSLLKAEVGKSKAGDAATNAATLTVDPNKIYEGNSVKISVGSNAATYVFTKDMTGKTDSSDTKYVDLNSSDVVKALAAKIGNGATASGDTIKISTTGSGTAAAATVAVSEWKGNRGLSLQIGPTADKFNQLDVNISDCHTYAMGMVDKDGNVLDGKSIADISIANQEDAQKAIDVIKAAVNYVSDVRGTLGATQNRLDHTINNLSVMTENIQDAESTIRDVDVAEEMMAYTKNNILIQSAQAMLAQANQVPQGVLQLLQ